MIDKESLIVAEIPRLRRYARALTGDAAAADDLVQDCLERAWGRFHLWRRGSDMRAWLFTIMHNIHANDLRRTRRRPSHLTLAEDTAGAEDPRQLGTLESLGLARALARLPEDQRTAVLLIGLEDMSYAEAAKILGLPIGTVRSRLARGRERLRRLMAGDGPEVVKGIK
jgi:RNA polymerase sigma-70 factor (ECF subfamily)